MGTPDRLRTRLPYRRVSLRTRLERDRLSRHPEGLFATMWGAQRGGGGLPVGTTMLATFGTFGVLSVCLFTPDLSVADDRERGWLRAAATVTGTLEATGGALVRLVVQVVLFTVAIASGLWFPLGQPPDAVAAAAPFLPTYHLAELRMAQLSGDLGIGHAAVLLATGAVGAAPATVSYRSARP